MHESLLFCVALPCTEKVLNLITFFSIPSDIDIKYEALPIPWYGLFIYRSMLRLERIDNDSEWLLEDKDVGQVLAMYANKNFNGICEYLNTLPERPFNVCINSAF